MFLSINSKYSFCFSFKDVAYNLKFKTGDMPHAGTDANVTLQLFGDKGQTEKIMLRQESGKTLKRFDRGRTDRFTVQTMDVGKVSKRCIIYTSTPVVREVFFFFYQLEGLDCQKKNLGASWPNRFSDLVANKVFPN